MVGHTGRGVDGDETFEQAAIREAAEELATVPPNLTPLWHRTVEFSFRGTLVRQEERYFLLEIAPHRVVADDGVRAAHSLEGIVRMRWWSLEEIESTSELVFPEDLGARLRELGILPA